MAWYPGATHWPLNCETSDRSHTPVRMTLHTAVSGAQNLYRYGPYRGTYSTFYVNGVGEVYQYASTSQATRASGAGNFGDISVETWDGASERALTGSQVTALGQLLAWIWDTHPHVPRRIATPGDLRGLAWHRLGCAGDFGRFDPTDRKTWCRAQTGARWSTAYGKNCPYDAKIDQLDDIYHAALGDSRDDPEPIKPPLGDTMIIVWRVGDNVAYLVTGCSMRRISWEEYQAIKIANPDIPEHSAYPETVQTLMEAVHAQAKSLLDDLRALGASI